jgi:signal transduction histidine kinase
VTVPLQVLLVEDSADDAALLARAFARSGWAPTCERVETEAALRTALGRSTFDVAVSDWVLPSFSGMAALAIVQAQAPDVPVIICSGKIDEEMAVAALRAGAKDFVTKGNLARLAPAVTRELRETAARRERRRADEELQRFRSELTRARRLEEAGTVASQVAHDVRNLLTPLLLYPEQIRRQLDAEHPAQALCQRLSTGLGRLSDVIEDMLTMGRRGRLSTEPTNLNNVVLDALDGLRDPPPTLAVNLDLAPELPSVSGAPGQLGRALANLLTNAREAMHDRGVLSVRTAPAELAAPKGLLPAGLHAVVEVADTGCGIPADQLDRVFEPFFTTKGGGVRSGSGLGLAIVQAIVTDHGGTVAVTSQLGLGTRFTISIPAT